MDINRFVNEADRIAQERECRIQFVRTYVEAVRQYMLRAEGEAQAAIRRSIDARQRAREARQDFEAVSEKAEEILGNV